MKDGRYLILRTERWKWNHETVDIVARVVNVRDNMYMYAGGEYQNLEVQAVYPQDNPQPTTGRVQYGLTFSTGLEDARSMVKTLGRISRRLQKAEDSQGAPRDYADSVMRFGSAIGARGIVSGNQQQFVRHPLGNAGFLVSMKVKAHEVDHVKR